MTKSHKRAPQVLASRPSRIPVVVRDECHYRKTFEQFLTHLETQDTVEALLGL